MGFGYHFIVVCLWILFSPNDIFILHKKKQKSCQCVSCTRHSLYRLLVARTASLSSCNRDSAALFDSSWRPLSLWVARVWWVDVVWPRIAFLSFFSFSFFLDFCAGHAKIYTIPSIYFLFWLSPSYPICNCFLYIDCF